MPAKSGDTRGPAFDDFSQDGDESEADYEERQEAVMAASLVRCASKLVGGNTNTNNGASHEDHQRRATVAVSDPAMQLAAAEAMRTAAGVDTKHQRKLKMQYSGFGDRRMMSEGGFDGLPKVWEAIHVHAKEEPQPWGKVPVTAVNTAAFSARHLQ